MTDAFRQLSRRTKTLLSSGLLLIIYGYLCRAGGLYFFWESKSVGWTLLLIGIISFLADRIKIKKTEKRKHWLEQIIICFICFVFLIQAILLIVIPFSDAFSVAKTYLQNNDDIKNEVGDVTGFGLIPTGGIQKSTDSQGESGNAAITLTIKGDKKFKDVIIYVVKRPDTTSWVVDGLE
jgi:uncharacterized protein with PQ loop repeat